jgi:hypothetical protein
VGAVIAELMKQKLIDETALTANGHIDATATMDPQSGKIALFLLNRDLVSSRQVDILRKDKSTTQ